MYCFEDENWKLPTSFKHFDIFGFFFSIIFLNKMSNCCQLPHTVIIIHAFCAQKTLYLCVSFYKNKKTTKCWIRMLYPLSSSSWRYTTNQQKVYSQVSQSLCETVVRVDQILLEWVIKDVPRLISVSNNSTNNSNRNVSWIPLFLTIVRCRKR